MTSVPTRAVAAALLAVLAAACQPTDGVIMVGAGEAGGGDYLTGTPEYAPDDPCRGVVPQLCPR